MPAMETLRELISRHKPNVTLLILGSGDMLMHMSELLKKVRKFISIAKGGGALPAIMTPPPITSKAVKMGLLPKDKYSTMARRIEEHVASIRSSFGGHEALLIDIHRFLTRRPRLCEHIYDGVHLDDVAQAAIAPYIASKLLKLVSIKGYPLMGFKEFIKVYSNGMHNAFTDIALWKGQYWLCFRTGSRHFIREKADGSITVLRSPDLYKWDMAVRLKVRGWDNRDPKLMPWGSKLFLYTPSWSPELRTHTTFCFYTTNGEEWQGPFKCGNYVFWRPHLHRDKAYVAAYKVNKEDWEVHLLESNDGINWRYVSTITRGDKANETDILFENEKAYAFTRREAGTKRLLMLESKAPFTKWQAKELTHIIQGPAVMRIGGEIMIAGRFYLENGSARTGLFVLRKGELKLVFELPSGGDCSYPGMLLRDKTLIVSYYSSHEGSGTSDAPSDIYLAVLDLL